jgi:hypothetical protein
MSTATLAGKTVTHARVSLPAWGLPWAEVSLDEEIALSSRVELALADLKFSGTVMSGGIGPKGRSSFRLVAGAGGWGKTIPPKSYANDAVVKTATVLQDAASACGEALDAATMPSTRLAAAWARPEGAAARVLEQLVPAGWYVGEDGVTRIGRRPAIALTAKVDIAEVDRARGTVALAAEAIASLVPGIVVEGIEAVDVLHELAPGSLRTTIWGAGIASTSRRFAALRRIFDALDPDRKYRGLYEYRIVTQTGERLNLQPVRVSNGMPDLQLITVRPGVPGAKATHALGARVVVGFLDRVPVVLGFEDADGSGFVATMLEFAGDVALPVARQTDPVQAGPWSGTIIGPCSTKMKVA